MGGGPSDPTYSDPIVKQWNQRITETAPTIMFDDLEWWGTALRQAQQLQPAPFRAMAAAGRDH